MNLNTVIFGRGGPPCPLSKASDKLIYLILGKATSGLAMVRPIRGGITWRRNPPLVWREMDLMVGVRQRPSSKELEEGLGTFCLYGTG
jgi:hypothetical protein